MGLITDLSTESIASGIIGLLTIGAIARSVFKGWIEAKGQSSNIGANTAAMMGAVAIGFDKEERASIVGCLGRIAGALEAISLSQASIVDSQRNDMDEKLDFLVAKLDGAQADRERSRRASDVVRRKPRPRAKRAGA